MRTLSAELADEKEKSEQCTHLQEELNAMSKKLVDLEGQMQMQKAVSGLSHGASWQYEIDDGWEAFTREGNEKMHQAYLEFLRGIPGSQRAIINSGGVDRVVDFHLMQQEHLMTHKVSLAARTAADGVLRTAWLQGSDWKWVGRRSRWG